MALVAGLATMGVVQAGSTGTGNSAGASNNELIKVDPDHHPKPCAKDNKPTAFCRCLKENSKPCKRCLKIKGHICFWCPRNPKMMIACRVFKDNPGHHGVVTPTTAGTMNATPNSNSNFTQPNSADSSPAQTNSGDGNAPDAGSNNPQPTPNPDPGCNQNANPHMGINCRAPGNSGGGTPGCPYLEVCTAQ